MSLIFFLLNLSFIEVRMTPPNQPAQNLRRLHHYYDILGSQWYAVNQLYLVTHKSEHHITLIYCLPSTGYRLFECVRASSYEGMKMRDDSTSPAYIAGDDDLCSLLLSSENKPRYEDSTSFDEQRYSSKKVVFWCNYPASSNSAVFNSFDSHT